MQVTHLDPSSTYAFTYTVLVEEEYFDNTDVLANDYFQNVANIEGVWGDQITVGRTGEEGDEDAASIRTPRPELDISVFNEETSEWVEQLDATIGDIVKMKLDVNFPEKVPTEKVFIHNYI